MCLGTRSEYSNTRECMSYFLLAPQLMLGTGYYLCREARGGRGGKKKGGQGYFRSAREGGLNYL